MVSGRSYEEIEEMTLEDVNLIMRYYEKHPPLEELVHAIAISLGVAKAPPQVQSAQPTTDFDKAKVEAQKAAIYAAFSAVNIELEK